MLIPGTPRSTLRGSLNSHKQRWSDGCSGCYRVHGEDDVVVRLEGPASPVNEDWKLNFNSWKAVKAIELQYETSNPISTGPTQTRNNQETFNSRVLYYCPAIFHQDQGDISPPEMQVIQYFKRAALQPKYLQIYVKQSSTCSTPVLLLYCVKQDTIFHSTDFASAF